MNTHKLQHDNHSRQILFRLVFGSRLSAIPVALLLSALLLQPFHQVLASTAADDVEEISNTDSDVSSISEPEPEPETETESAAESKTVTREDELEPRADDNDEVISDDVTDESLNQSATMTEPISDIDSESTSDTDDEVTSTSTPDVSQFDEASTTDESSIRGAEDGDFGTPTSETESDIDVSADDEVTASTSATEAADVETVVADSATPESSDRNKYQFARDECFEVGDGAYYCQPVQNTTQATYAEDQVYSDLGSSGYPEIFLQQRGRVTQITDNTFDDAAPQYDPVSNSLVWHRNVDGVWQIVSYDLASQEEQLLTQTDYNNMQPARSGQYTVWQRWIDGAWQIVLLEDSQERIISQGDQHSVAPYISGDYVVWNSSSATGERVVMFYSLVTEQVSLIDDNDGGQVTNPRFVLMYDTKFANGDIVTKGFDPETGEVMPLAALPAVPIPDIPTADPTGETRALINTKSASEDDEVSDDNPVPSPVSTASTTISSSTDSTTLEVASTTSSVADDVSLSEYDLVVTPIATSSVEDTSAVASTSNSTE